MSVSIEQKQREQNLKKQREQIKINLGKLSTKLNNFSTSVETFKTILTADKRKKKFNDKCILDTDCRGNGNPGSGVECMNKKCTTDNEYVKSSNLISQEQEQEQEFTEIHENILKQPFEKLINTLSDVNTKIKIKESSAPAGAGPVGPKQVGEVGTVTGPATRVARVVPEVGTETKTETKTEPAGTGQDHQGQDHQGPGTVVAVKESEPAGTRAVGTETTLSTQQSGTETKTETTEKTEPAAAPAPAPVPAQSIEERLKYALNKKVIQPELAEIVGKYKTIGKQELTKISKLFTKSLESHF